MTDKHQSSNPVRNRDVVKRFESIGINCEFGVVQKNLGIRRLGLLKWANSQPHSLIESLKAEFMEFGNPGLVEVGIKKDEYFYKDLKYGFSGHSHVKTISTPKHEFQTVLEARLRFLRDKFVEDLKVESRIYLYKQNAEPLEVALVNQIADLIGSYGKGKLLWICDSRFTGQFPGTIERITEKFVRGHISKLASYENAIDVDMPGWIEVCKNALMEFNQVYA